MYGMQTLISTLSVALLFLVSPQKAPAPTETLCSWGAKEIGKQAPPYGVEGRVYVLAWKLIEDERPLRVDSLLVLSPGTWHLGEHLGEVENDDLSTDVARSPRRSVSGRELPTGPALRGRVAFLEPREPQTLE